MQGWRAVKRHNLSMSARLSDLQDGIEGRQTKETRVERGISALGGSKIEFVAELRVTPVLFNSMESFCEPS